MSESFLFEIGREYIKEKMARMNTDNVVWLSIFFFQLHSLCFKYFGLKKMIFFSLMKTGLRLRFTIRFDFFAGVFFLERFDLFLSIAVVDLNCCTCRDEWTQVDCFYVFVENLKKPYIYLL